MDGSRAAGATDDEPLAFVWPARDFGQAPRELVRAGRVCLIQGRRNASPRYRARTRTGSASLGELADVRFRSGRTSHLIVLAARETFPNSVASQVASLDYLDQVIIATRFTQPLPQSECRLIKLMSTAVPVGKALVVIVPGEDPEDAGPCQGPPVCPSQDGIARFFWWELGESAFGPPTTPACEAPCLQWVGRLARVRSGPGGPRTPCDGPVDRRGVAQANQRAGERG